MNKVSSVRAVEAFSKGLGTPPVLANDASAWGGISVCDWRSPWLAGFELHENDDFVIAYHSGGSRQVRAACNGPWSESKSTPGLISVIPPGRRVEYRIGGKVGFSSVHIPRSLFEGLVQSGFGWQADFRFAFHDEFASSCMQVLLDEARSHQSRFPYTHAVTRALVIHLTEKYRERQTGSPATPAASEQHSVRKLDRMLDFIDASLSEHLTLDNLAQRVGVSRAHFARRFRDLTGMSPHRYLMNRRVEKAKKLLKETRISLANIALEVGFSNQAHFSAAFHTMTGLTPSHYRLDDMPLKSATCQRSN